MVECEEDVVMLSQVGGKLDLNLLVKVRSLVVIRHSRENLVQKLRTVRLPVDHFQT